MNATIIQNEIAVDYSYRPDVQREFLSFDVPNGWEDVKKVCKKILLYDGKRFAFTGWNSDTNKCYFAKPIGIEIKTAKIVK